MSTAVAHESPFPQVADYPRVVLPSAAHFAERGTRFRHLAAGHPMEGFLRFLGAVSDAQAAILPRRAAAALPEPALAASREHGMPPLNATSHARDASWTEDLHDLVRELAAWQVPALPALSAMSRGDLDEAADRLLAGSSRDDEGGLVPFLGAALQVYFTRRARTLAVADVAQCDVATVCPVCACRPLASVVRVGGAQSGLRYLACGLCGTEWNLPRITCSFCGEDKGVQYFGLEASGARVPSAAWRAEACDECGTYLKILYQDKDPLLDPVADDFASFALDVLMDERGFARSGPNYLFHPGAE